MTSTLANEIRDLFEAEDMPAVERFLEENPWLRSILREARERIRRYFGPTVEVALQVVADPEALGDRQLFVLIRSEGSAAEAREHLARLDEEWWLDALPATEGKLEVALE